MKKLLIITAVLLAIVATLTALQVGYISGKNHVIYTQEIYTEGGELFSAIDGEVHSYN